MQARSAMRTTLQRRFARLFISSPFLDSDVRNAPAMNTGLRDAEQTRIHPVQCGRWLPSLTKSRISAEMENEACRQTCWAHIAGNIVVGIRHRRDREPPIDPDSGTRTQPTQAADSHDAEIGHRPFCRVHFVHDATRRRSSTRLGMKNAARTRRSF